MIYVYRPTILMIKSGASRATLSPITNALLPQDVATTGDCTAECNAEPTCKFWAHMSVPKNCMLYTALNAKTPNFGSGWSCGTRSA